jgi:hypothetical protein
MLIRQSITTLLRRSSTGIAPSVVLPVKSCIITGTTTSFLQSTKTDYARATNFQLFSTADDKQEKKEDKKEDESITFNFLPRDGEADGVTDKDIGGVDMSQYTDEVKLKMPDMDSDGKVLKWYKKEGDLIKRDETLCDIELEVSTAVILSRAVFTPPPHLIHYQYRLAAF